MSNTDTTSTATPATQPVTDGAAVTTPASPFSTVNTQPIGPVRATAPNPVSAVPPKPEDLKAMGEKLQSVGETLVQKAEQVDNPAVAQAIEEVVEHSEAALTTLVDTKVKEAGEQVKGTVIDEIDKAVNKVQDGTASVMERLSLMLREAGEQLHEGWDEACIIASHMAKDEKEMPEKVKLVLSTIGHDVGERYDQYAAFIKKYL